MLALEIVTVVVASAVLLLGLWSFTTRQRPWVTVAGVRALSDAWIGAPGYEASFEVDITNLGEIPAQNLKIRLVTRIADGPNELEAATPETRLRASDHLLPRQTTACRLDRHIDFRVDYRYLELDVEVEYQSPLVLGLNRTFKAKTVWACDLIRSDGINQVWTRVS